MTSLSVDAFEAFFREVHGYDPFPWQSRLMRHVAGTDTWPTTVDLPTGSGKTAAIDVAVFHLALEADRTRNDRGARLAPLRIAFVVDRRLVVDAAHERAKQIAARLRQPSGPIASLVAEALSDLAGGNGPPLAAVRLRGGIPRENGWARTPVQPTVLTATVDQIGSRLLFRGYGLSDRAKPIHAGLLGTDTLVLLDEAHLAEPFRQTMDWVQRYAGPDWRTKTDDAFVPFRYVSLSATAATSAAISGGSASATIALDDDDRAHPVLKRRLAAEKPVRLVAPLKTRRSAGEEIDDHDGSDDTDAVGHVEALAAEARRLLGELAVPASASSRGFPALAVIVNRVARARALHRLLSADLSDSADVELLIGPARPVDRDVLTMDPSAELPLHDGDAYRQGLLTRIGTGREVPLRRPLVLVTTQTIEVGVDVDLDGIVSDLAPLDALQQRFGRLDRDGVRPAAAGSIVAEKRMLSSRHDDPVYGKSLKLAWDHLVANAVRQAGHPVVSFRIDAVRAIAASAPDGAASERPDAPILMPAHVDILAQTSPVPDPDPDVALFLRGPRREPASVTVIWRADVTTDLPDDVMRRLLLLVRPRSGEAIELPVGAVKRWLSSAEVDRDLADVAGRSEGAVKPGQRPSRRVFRFAGDDDRSKWIRGEEIRPGDTIVVPAVHGGVDSFGFDPDSTEPAVDVADAAAAPFERQVFTARIAAGLLLADETPPAKETSADRRLRHEARKAKLDAIGSSLATIVADPTIRNAADLAAELRRTSLADADPLAVERLVNRLDLMPSGRRCEVVRNAYGDNESGGPRGAVVIARGGIGGRSAALDDGLSATAIEDDLAGSIAEKAIGLDEHEDHVSAKARDYAARLGLAPEVAADVVLAARLHDTGKADPRFQAWLAGGDPLGAASDKLLAKSARPLPPGSAKRAGLPDRWRHEALSVRIAKAHPALAAAADPDLVLWLIGTHHGHGRPFFPFGEEGTEQVVQVRNEPLNLPRSPGPQSLAFDHEGRDWASMKADLERRYGVWRLAQLEGLLRLADQTASADEQVDGFAGKGGEP